MESKYDNKFVSQEVTNNLIMIENKMLPVPLKYTYPVIMEIKSLEKYKDLVFFPEEGRWILKCNLRRFLELRNIDYVVWKSRWVLKNTVDYGSDNWIYNKILLEYPNCFKHTRDYIVRNLKTDPKFKCNPSIILKEDFIEQYYESRKRTNRKIYNYDFSLLPEMISSKISKVTLLVHDIDPKTGKELGEYKTNFNRFITEGKDFNKLVYLYVAPYMNRSNDDGFIQKSKSIFGDKFEYLTPYVDSNTKIKMKCKDCGTIFEVTPTNHLNSRFGGCYTCLSIFRSENNVTPIDSFLKRAEEIHGNKYDYSKVIEENQFNKGMDSRLDIYCNTCHEFFNQSARDHIYSKSGCPTCGMKRAGKLNTTSQDIIVGRLVNEFGELYDYSKVNYSGNKKPITLICPKHGEFTIIPTHIGRSLGCPSCNCRSTGSMYVDRWIKENSLESSSKREKTFYGIEGRNSNIVRCDFIIIYNNIIFWIEYNGIQHYEEFCFFNESHEDFLSQLKRDQNVKDYCKENNYIYVEIPYTYNTYEKVKELLDRVILGGEDINTIVDYSSLYKIINHRTI